MLSKDFILAGKAIFTVTNNRGDYYTFRVTKKESPQWGVKYFAAMLTGPNNEQDYTYLAVVNPVSGVPHLTRASQFQNDSKPYKVLRWTLDIVWGRCILPIGYKLEHAGRCGRCGRTLTTPDSIQCGIGPECRKNMGL